MKLIAKLISRVAAIEVGEIVNEWLLRGGDGLVRRVRARAFRRARDFVDPEPIALYHCRTGDTPQTFPLQL
jgi:hypothetical protein